MERGEGNDESIVFPDDHYSSPSIVDDYEVTTVTSHQKSSSNITVIVIVILSICFILIVGVIILYKKYQKSQLKEEKADPLISLPTLGTQYELASLLTINTTGRKDSDVSEGSNQAGDDLEKGEKSEDVFDGRVSKYIDASTVEMNKAEEYIAESGDYSLKNILDITTDTRLGSSQSVNLQPPHAVPENDTSRPMSMTDETNQISIIGGGASVSRPISKIMEELSDSSSNSQEIPNFPTVIPPSPSCRKTRPKSEYVENPPPSLPAKKKLGSAYSEMVMNKLDEIPPSPTSARSDSHLAIIPPVPPKSKPFLPPKQTINKSKEDVARINKEILRVSSQNMNRQSNPDNHLMELNNEVDIDYDFPTGPGDEDDEEYDEPCPVLPQQDLHEQLDYDDPVQKYQ